MKATALIVATALMMAIQLEMEIPPMMATQQTMVIQLIMEECQMATGLIQEMTLYLRMMGKYNRQPTIL